jgi:hypothetical protein
VEQGADLGSSRHLARACSNMAPSASNNFEVRDDRRRHCQPVDILFELSRQVYVAALVGNRVATLADDAMKA